ncbi:HNH endonuclease [Georgenia sp. Z1491]|uniref:HNH endonuclease n=1 Tax=Georgenia sp. Z1491 TaxID=3416707 RepID=UPI003CE9B624
MSTTDVDEPDIDDPPARRSPTDASAADDAAAVEHLTAHDTSATGTSTSEDGVPPGASSSPGAGEIRGMRTVLAGLRREDEADAIDQITALEELVSAARAAQARATADLWQMRTDHEKALEVPAAKQGQGVAGEIALARRESPGRGARYLGLAKALQADLPHTLDLMEKGLVSEWRATILLRETVTLSADDRREVDARMAVDLPTMGDGQIHQHARRHAMELDADNAAARRAHENSQRRVSLRGGQGSMAYLTAHLPMTDAVRVHASLTAQAATLTTDGKAGGRTRHQLAADLLVEHVTGTATTEPRDVALTIVMPADTLAGADVPAWLTGHGPLAAESAREHVRHARTVWFKRLWTDPDTGGVVSMESRSRVFTGELRKLVLIRDDICRTPYCTNPVEHIDHTTDHALGGATSAANATGLCASCNYAKQHPGWRYATSDDGRIDVRTPTGHTYSVPRSPFPYQHRPGPEMTTDRYQALRRRVAERVTRNRRSERDPHDDGGSDPPTDPDP